MGCAEELPQGPWRRVHVHHVIDQPLSNSTAPPIAHRLRARSMACVIIHTCLLHEAFARMFPLTVTLATMVCSACIHLISLSRILLASLCRGANRSPFLGMRATALQSGDDDNKADPRVQGASSPELDVDLNREGESHEPCAVEAAKRMGSLDGTLLTCHLWGAVWSLHVFISSIFDQIICP